jgi:hypothetical protein
MDVDPLSPPDFTKLADRFAASLGEIAQFTILKSDPFKMIESFIALALSIPIALFAELATAAGVIIVKTLENVNPQIAQLASLTLSEVFGQEVTLGGITGGHGTGVATQLGKELLNGILGLEAAGAGGELQPGFEPAERLMGTLLGVPIRGWLLETVTELGSLGQIKLFHELVEDVQQAIGAGRLARVALQPAIKAAIATPAEWKVLQSLRPSLLSPGIIAKAYNRGHINAGQAYAEMALLGFADWRIDEILNDAAPKISPAGVASLWHHGQMDEAEAIAYVQDQGYTQEDAQRILSLPALAVIDGIKQTIIDVYDQAYVDWFIDDQEYLSNVQDFDYDPNLAPLRLQRVQLKRQFSRRSLTLAQLNAALAKNIIDLLEWRKALQDQGYVDDDITILELTARETASDKETQAAAKAAAKQSAADAKAAAAATKAQAAADKKAAADQAKAAIQQQRAVDKASAAAATEAKKQLAAAAALQLTQARQAAENQKLIDAQAAAALKVATAANIQQQTILTQSLLDAQKALDDSQAAADRAQLTAQTLADQAAAAVADAISRSDLEEQTILARRAERIAAFESRLALVDQQEADGLITDTAAVKQREHLQELEDEAEAAEELDELAIQKSVDQAKSVQGAALAKVAAAAAQASLLPTAAEKTQQQIAAAAAGKAKLSADVAASKLAADAKISAQRIATFNDAAAKYDALLQQLEQQRQQLEAAIQAGTPLPPG